jgi:hypothetical protein
MAADGACLTGPQPIEGIKREFLRYAAGSLRVRVGTRRLRRRSPNPMRGFHALEGMEEVKETESQRSTPLPARMKVLLREE